MKSGECDCSLCQRSREFVKHLEKVSDKDAKEFFEKIYDLLLNVELDNQVMVAG